MAKTPAPQVTLQRPDGPDRNALRAGLLTLQCFPVTPPPPGAALTEQLALDRAACTVGLPALAADELDRYLRAVPTAPSSLSPHALIRARTALDAEALADLLQFKLDIRDRSYHLKKYPACFLASEAVQWMRSHFRLDNPQVVEV